MDYVAAMRKLLRRADVVLPNVTEACFLTGTEYVKDYDGLFIEKLESGLKKITDGKIIITGIEYGGNIGESISGNKRGEMLWHELLPVKKHGTGDIFASVFTANYLAGKSVHDSVSAAAEFVRNSISATDDKHFYGVYFEKTLKSIK